MRQVDFFWREIVARLTLSQIFVLDIETRIAQNYFGKLWILFKEGEIFLPEII